MNKAKKAYDEIPYFSAAFSDCSPQFAAADDTVADGADTAVEVMRFQFFHQGNHAG